MTKRAAGEGTIYQRPDGRWRGRISLGHDKAGKRLQKTVYGKTQAEVVDKLDDLKRQARLNAKAIVATDSLAAYLQRWLADDVAINKASKTYEEYEAAVRLLVTPYIGAVKLQDLDGERLQQWQATLKREGKSDNQRRRGYRILRNALNKAVRHNRIAFNPIAAVDVPSVERGEAHPLEQKVCFQIFDLAKDHRLGDILPLAIMTGLRMREIFALEWSAVNIREGVLSVRKSIEEITKKTMRAVGAKSTVNEKSTKTRKSKRVITLESIAIAALQSRLEKAKAEGFDPAEVPLVFPNLNGGHLRSSNFNRQVWNPIRDAVGIRDSTTFHDLRHTQASLMLYAGADMKVIQERLGHADFATTANMYAHLMPDSQAKATEKLAAMMDAAKPSEVTG